MRNNLLNDYAFHGSTTKKKNGRISGIAKGVLGNSTGHIVLFAVIICIIGNLANDPSSGISYTWLPALLSTMA